MWRWVFHITDAQSLTGHVLGMPGVGVTQCAVKSGERARTRAHICRCLRGNEHSCPSFQQLRCQNSPAALRGDIWVLVFLFFSLLEVGP